MILSSIPLTTVKQISSPLALTISTQFWKGKQEIFRMPNSNSSWITRFPIYTELYRTIVSQQNYLVTFFINAMDDRELKQRRLH